MAARADKAPWDPSKLTKGTTWDLSSGWAQRHSGYKKTKKYTSSGDVRVLHTAEGKEVKLYYSENYKNTKVGFYAHEDAEGKPTNTAQEALAFAEDAFSREEGVKSHTGAGHIANLEYALEEQILKVTFANGTVCIFFQVPTAVAGELLYLAGKGEDHKRSDGRHYLGITFWDLVRIRGQRTGARYPFEYQSHADYKLSGSNTRYGVQISAATYRKLFRNHKEFDIQEQIRPFKDGDIVSVILSPDEMNLYAEYINMVEDDKENRRIIERAGHHKKVMRTNEQGETVEDIMDLDDLSNEDVQSSSSYARPNPYRQNIEDAVAKQAEAWRGMILDKADSIYMDPVTRDIANVSMAHGKDLKDANLFAFREVAKGLGRQDILKAIDQGEIKQALVDLKDSLKDNSHLARLAQIADGQGALQSWLKRMVPGAYANMTMQRGWTPQQLVEFANDTVPGGLEGRHKRAYKKYIDNRDWQGALDYLKRTDTTVELTGKDGRSTGKKYIRKYAGRRDFVAMED